MAGQQNKACGAPPLPALALASAAGLAVRCGRHAPSMGCSAKGLVLEPDSARAATRQRGRLGRWALQLAAGLIVDVQLKLAACIVIIELFCGAGWVYCTAAIAATQFWRKTEC